MRRQSDLIAYYKDFGLQEQTVEKSTDRHFRFRSRYIDSRLARLPKSPDGANRLSKKKLGVAGDDVVSELSDELVALPLIESARPRVEGGDAEEDVGRLAEDP